jgi:hypothetical protein
MANTPKKHTVKFNARKTVKLPTEVEFKTKSGTKVDFFAKKATKVPVKVSFKARDK